MTPFTSNQRYSKVNNHYFCFCDYRMKIEIQGIFDGEMVQITTRTARRYERIR